MPNVALFLDIDGVLHPDGVARTYVRRNEAGQFVGHRVFGDGLWQWAEPLIQLLREFPEVDVVVHSTWRHEISLDDIRSHMPSGLAERVVGLTPKRPYERLESIREYCAQHGIEQFVIVDDSIGEFPRHKESTRPLGPTEHKAAHGEHIRWILGPEEEVALVRRLFRVYARTEISVVHLAALLRKEGVCTSKGKPVTEWMLYSLLRSEALIGNFFWAVPRTRRDEARLILAFAASVAALPRLWMTGFFRKCKRTGAPQAHGVQARGSGGAIALGLG